MLFHSSRQRWFYFGLGILSLCLALAGTPAIATQKTAPTPIVVASPGSATVEVGRQLYRSGRFAEAILVWQTAIEHYRQQGDRVNQALSLSYLSTAQQELSQWQAARQSIDQSLEILTALQPPADAILWAQALNTQASLWLQMGKSEAALETWQRSQKYYEKAGDTLGSLGSQINQAQALQSLGFYRRARQQLEALNQKLAALPDSEIKVSGLRSLGSALQTIGDSEQSQTVLQASLTLARKLGLTSELSSTLLNLGRTAASLDAPQAALDAFEQAEALATNPVDRLQARLDQFKLFVDYNLLSQAAPIAPQLLTQLQELPASRTSLYNTIYFVASLNKLEDPAQLVPLKDMAQLMATTVRSAQQLQDVQAESYALNQWGQLYQRTGQFSEAQQLMERSLNLARQLSADDIVSQSAWKLGQILQRQGDRASAIAHYTEAVRSLKSLRGDLVAVNPDVQFSFRESVEPVYRGLVDLLLDDSQPGGPSQAALMQARETIEALQVAEIDNFFREACLNKVQQIDQVDPTATVVYPIILPDRLSVILSTAGQPLTYYTTQVPQAEVQQTLTDLLAALNPVSDVKAHLKLSNQVYSWLIRPAEAAQALKNTKTLVFVLDGKLRNLPMSALHDGKQYLIEKYAVTLSPGLQLMVARSLKSSQIRALVGGISQARSGFAALPAVEAEVEQISQTVSASAMLNQAFTNNAIADRVKNSQINIVHLATHGQFSSRLAETFLLTWDGQVNIKELSELLQSRSGAAANPIDLLVLSACDTATGDDRAVLGLAGLAVKSGARSTVATLWPVKDKAAALLMSDFYQKLKVPGVTKAEALRQAQVDLIRKTEFREPFFWSAFVLVGNWQ